MIEISPFPHGKDFAVTFVDDTDFSTRANTEPVYEFLRSQNFLGTKTVWPLRAKRTSAFRREDERAVCGSSLSSTLEDPDYLEFVVGLQKEGFEIGLHGVSEGNSLRGEILVGLERFRSIFGRDPAINAFHRTNIENLYCGADKLDSLPLRAIERIVHRSDYQGHREGSPYFWGDVARDVFKYVRLPFHTISNVNTLRVSPIMPFHDPTRPYVGAWFAASDGAHVARFNRLLSGKNIAKLERERGACVIYTHFAKGFLTRQDGKTRLDPVFVEAVTALGGRPNAWLPTASDLLDRLAAVRKVSLVHSGHRLRIRNCGDAAIEGLTLKAKYDAELRDGSGGPLPACGSGKAVLPRLLPGETVELRTDRSGDTLIEPRLACDISPRQRRAIEYRNYLGLIRGSLFDYRDHARARRSPGRRPEK